MTGLAAIAGVIGMALACGWRTRLPRGSSPSGILHDGKDELERLIPTARVRLRETGRVIRAQVAARPPDLPLNLKTLSPGHQIECGAWLR
jgi:hypothetical protein